MLPEDKNFSPELREFTVAWWVCGWGWKEEGFSKDARGHISFFIGRKGGGGRRRVSLNTVYLLIKNDITKNPCCAIL